MTNNKIKSGIIKRICQFCNSDKSWYDNKKKVYLWRKINGKYTCHKCYMKRRIIFKDKRLRVFEKELTGICKLCNRSIEKGEIKQTQFHHTEYHDNNPLENTIEICVKCHYDQHKTTRKRDINGRFI